MRIRAKEAEARIRTFTRQQELSEKLKSQQTLISRDGGGSRMSPQDDVEAFLEAFERPALSAKWDPASWAMRLGPFLIGQA